MLLWTLIVLLTAAAIVAVLAPLRHAPRAAASDAHARQVYRDQLDELERDKAEGRVSAADAEATRAEIARRLIALDSEPDAEPQTAGSPALRRTILVAAVAGIPALSFSLYVMLGAPNLPGAPLSARLEAPSGSSDIEVLVARTEQHLARNPEDGRGWEVIAPVYLRLGRPDDSVRAFRNAIRILGSTAGREIRLGEAIWAAENGIVTADARAAFEEAHRLDPAAPQPRFFLAIAAQQEGNTDEARQWLNALLADTPADASWRPAVVAALAELGVTDIPPGTQPETPAEAPRGPSEADVAAAQQMSSEDRMAMIEGMVSGLAARLESEPDDAEGWIRLIRSYVVLGQSDAAADAARAALAGVSDNGDRQRVEALIADLGVTPAAEATQ